MVTTIGSCGGDGGVDVGVAGGCGCCSRRVVVVVVVAAMLG